MPHAQVSKKTTLWLGSDDDELEDGDPVGMQGYGFDVNSEDHMVAIRGSTQGGDQFEVFIMRDLFSKIRAVMERIDGRFGVVSVTEARGGEAVLFDALDRLRLDAGQPSFREIAKGRGWCSQPVDRAQTFSGTARCLRSGVRYWSLSCERCTATRRISCVCGRQR